MTTLATDWITVGTQLGGDLKSLIFNVLIPVMCGVFVLAVGFKTRAPGPTLMAAVFAGMVLGLSLSLGTIGAATSDTVNHYGGGGSTIIQGDQ